MKDREIPFIFVFIWFFLMVLVSDAIVIYLSSLILGFLGISGLLLLIFLIIIGIIFFISFFILFYFWDTIKEIERDDQNFLWDKNL
ncbi:hypothetical protein KJ828_01785 [Patescibacteria group bacterium]|nr:hypothetical protein [Patescibacteria group bacterium]MBU4115532.1 hypothetical protein [Patescibacteria group bacterium]